MNPWKNSSNFLLETQYVDIELTIEQAVAQTKIPLSGH
jgi:hypothetical protein